MFHHLVVQLLFIIKGSRRDTQTEVSFLTSRVKLPYEYDWGKINIFLKYLKGTKHMKLTLIAEYLSAVKCWIETQHNTHNDGRGVYRRHDEPWKGYVISLSLKQRLNMNSSTLGELVGAHNGLNVILCSKYFIESQKYAVEHVKLYQYNNRTILMENNGRESS